MGVGEHVAIERIDLAGRIGQRKRDVGQASGLAFGLFRIKRVKHRAREKGMRGFRPMIDEAFAFRVDEDGDEVLHVADLVQRAEPDFFEGIETGATLRRARIEAQHRILGMRRAPSGRQVPKFRFLIVDDDAVGPGEKRGHDKAYAFAAARRRNGENMLGAVMPQIMQVLSATAARRSMPGADINPAPGLAWGGQQPSRSNFGSGRPMGCAVHAFVPLGAADAGAADRQQEKQAQSQSRRLYGVELTKHAWGAICEL